MRPRGLLSPNRLLNPSERQLILQRERPGALKRVAGRAWDPVDLASGVENQIEEKNDHLLTPALLAREYAARAFDLDGSAQVVASLLGQL